MKFPTLHHYSKTPLHAVGSIAPIHPEGKHQCGAHKPLGFWVSDDNDFGWAEWCKGENFGEYSYRYEVTLARPESLLWLRSEKAVRDFADEYCTPPVWHDELPSSFRDPLRFRSPLWGRIATKYAGIVITPYQWSLRLADAFSWYYGWDCASGVIWDGSAVASVSKVPMIEPWTEKLAQSA